MKNIAILALLFTLSGCETIGNLFDDDIERITVCSEATQDVALAEFTACIALDGDPGECLKQAEDACLESK